jgi:hypothetical protein
MITNERIIELFGQSKNKRAFRTLEFDAEVTLPIEQVSRSLEDQGWRIGNLTNLRPGVWLFELIKPWRSKGLL